MTPTHWLVGLLAGWLTVVYADTYARWELDEAAYTDPAVDSSGNGYTATYTNGGTWGVASQIDDGTAITFTTGGGTSITPIPAALVPADKEYSIETAFSYTGAGQQSVFYVNKAVFPFEGIEIRLNFNIAFGTTAGYISFRDGEYSNAAHMCVATGTYNDGVMRVYKFQRLQRANGSWYIRIVANGEIVCEKTIASIYVHDHTTETLFVASRTTAALLGTIEYTRFYIGSYVNIDRPLQVVARWEQDEASAGVAVYDSSYNGWDGIQEGGGTFGVTSVIDDGTAITYGSSSAAYISSTPSGLYFLDNEYTVEMAFSTSSTGQRTIFGQWQQTANFQGVEAQVNYNGATTTGGDGTIMLRSGDYGVATYACPTPAGYNDNVIRIFRFERRRIATGPDVWVLRVLVNGVIKCQKTLPSLVTHTYPNPPTYIASRTSTAGIVGTVEYTRFYIGAHYSDFGYTNATTPSVTLSTIETMRAALMTALYNQSTLPTSTRSIEGINLELGSTGFTYTLLNGTGTPWFFDRGTGNTRLIVYAGTRYQLITAKNGDVFLEYCLRMTPDADVLAVASLDWPHENRDLKDFLAPAVESLNYVFALRNYTDVTFVGFGSGGWVASVLCSLDTRLTRCFDVAGTWPFYVRAAQTEVVFNEYEERLPGLESVLPADYLDLYVLAGSLGNYTQVFNVEDDCCFNTVEGREYLQSVRSLVVSAGGGDFRQKYYNDTDGHVIPHDAYALLSGHNSITGHWPLDELSGSVVTDVIGGYELNRYSGATYGGAALNGDGGYSITLGVNNNCFIKDTTVNDFAVRWRPYGVKFWMRWSAGTGPHWNPVWVKSVAGQGSSLYCNYDWAGIQVGYCTFLDVGISGATNGLVTVGDGTWQDNVVRHHAAHRSCVGTEPCQWKVQYFIDGFLYNETNVDQSVDTVMWDPSNPADSIYLLFAGRTARVATGAFDDLWFSSGDSFSSTALAVEGAGVASETVAAFWRLDEASAAAAAVDSISGFDGAYTAGGTYSVASVIDTGTAITFAGTGGMVVSPTPDGLHVLDREFTLEIAFGFTGTTGRWIWLQMDLAAADDPGIGISVNMYGNGIGDVGCVAFRELRYDADFIIRASGSYNDGTVRRWKFQRILISRSPTIWVQRIIMDGEIVNQQVSPSPVYHYYPAEDTYVIFNSGTFSGTIEYTRLYAGPHTSERLYTNATAPCVTAATIETTRTALIQALFGQSTVPTVTQLNISSNSTFGVGTWPYSALTGPGNVNYFNRGTSNTKLIVYHGTADRTIDEDGGTAFRTYVLHMLPEADLLSVEFLPWPWEDKTLAELLTPAIDGLTYAFSVGGAYTEVVFVGYGAGGWVSDLMCSVDSRITHCFNVAGSWPFSVRNAHTDGLSNGEVFEHLHGLESVIPCDYLDLYVLASTNTDYMQVFNLGGIQFNTLDPLDYLEAVRAVTEQAGAVYKQKYVEDTGGTLTGNRVPPEVFDLVTRQPVQRSNWPFDELSGTNAEDVISGNNLTYTGGFILGQPPLTLIPEGYSVDRIGSGTGIYDDMPPAMKIRSREYSMDVWMSNIKLGSRVKTWYHSSGVDAVEVNYNTNGASSPVNGYVTFVVQSLNVVRLVATPTTLSDGTARHFGFDRKCTGTEPCEWIGSLLINGFLDGNVSITTLDDMLSADTAGDQLCIGGTNGFPQDGYIDDMYYTVGESHNYAALAARVVAGVSETFEARWELDEASAGEAAVESVNGWNATYTAGGTYGVASQVDNGTAITFAGTGATQVNPTPDGLWILDREYVIEIAFSFTGTTAKTLFGQYDSVDSNNRGAYVAVNYDGATVAGAVQFRDQRTTDTFRCNTYGTYNDGVMRVWKFKRVKKYTRPTVWALQTIADDVLVCEKIIPYALYHYYPGEPTTVAALPAQSFTGTIEYTRIRAGPIAPRAQPVTQDVNVVDGPVNLDAVVLVSDYTSHPTVYVTPTVSPPEAGTVALQGDPVETTDANGDRRTTQTLQFAPSEDYTGQALILFQGSLLSGATDSGVMTLSVSAATVDTSGFSYIVNYPYDYFKLNATATVYGTNKSSALTFDAALVPPEAGTVDFVWDQLSTEINTTTHVLARRVAIAPATDFRGTATLGYTVSVNGTGIVSANISLIFLSEVNATHSRSGHQATKLVAFYQFYTTNLSQTSVPNLVEGDSAAFGDLVFDLDNDISWGQLGRGLKLGSNPTSFPRIQSTGNSSKLASESIDGVSYTLEVWFQHLNGAGNIAGLEGHATIDHDSVDGVTWTSAGLTNDCEPTRANDTWEGRRADASGILLGPLTHKWTAPLGTIQQLSLMVDSSKQEFHTFPLMALYGDDNVTCEYCNFIRPWQRLYYDDIGDGYSLDAGLEPWGYIGIVASFTTGEPMEYRVPPWIDNHQSLCQAVVRKGSFSSKYPTVHTAALMHMGSENDTRPFTAQPLPSGSSLFVGHNESGAGTWSGYIYQMAVYAKSLPTKTFVGKHPGTPISESVIGLNYDAGPGGHLLQAEDTSYTVSDRYVPFEFNITGWSFGYDEDGVLSVTYNDDLSPAHAGVLNSSETVHRYRTENGINVTSQRYKFYPNSSFEGTVTLTYTVSNSATNDTGNGTVTLTVLGALNATYSGRRTAPIQTHRMVAFYDLRTTNLSETVIPNQVTGADAAFGDLELFPERGAEWGEHGIGVRIRSNSTSLPALQTQGTSERLAEVSTDGRSYTIEVWVQHKTGTGNILTLGDHAYLRHTDGNGLSWHSTGEGGVNCTEPQGAWAWGGDPLDYVSEPATRWLSVPTLYPSVNNIAMLTLSVGPNLERYRSPWTGAEGDHDCSHCTFPLAVYRHDKEPYGDPIFYSRRGWGPAISSPNPISPFISNALYWLENQPYVCGVDNRPTGSVYYGTGYRFTGQENDTMPFTASSIQSDAALSFGSDEWTGYVYQIAVYADAVWARKDSLPESDDATGGSFGVSTYSENVYAQLETVSQAVDVVRVITNPFNPIEVNISTATLFAGFAYTVLTVNHTLDVPHAAELLPAETLLFRVTDNGLNRSTARIRITPNASFVGTASFDFSGTNGANVLNGTVSLVFPEPLNATVTEGRTGDAETHRIVALYQMKTTDLSSTTIPNLVTGSDAAFGDLEFYPDTGVSWGEGGYGLKFGAPTGSGPRVRSTGTSEKLASGSVDGSAYTVEIWYRHTSGAGRLISLGDHMHLEHDGVTGLRWFSKGKTADCIEPQPDWKWGNQTLNYTDPTDDNVLEHHTPHDTARAGVTQSTYLAVGPNYERYFSPLTSLDTPLLGQQYCTGCAFPYAAGRFDPNAIPTGTNFFDWGPFGSALHYIFTYWLERHVSMCTVSLNDTKINVDSLQSNFFPYTGSEEHVTGFEAETLPLDAYLELASNGSWLGHVYQVAVYARDVQPLFKSASMAVTGTGAYASTLELIYDQGLFRTVYGDDYVIEGVHPYYPILVTLEGHGSADTIVAFDMPMDLEPPDAGVVGNLSETTCVTTDEGNTRCRATFEFTPTHTFVDNATVSYVTYNNTYGVNNTGVITFVGPQFTNTTTLHRNGSQAHKLVALYRMDTQDLTSATVPNSVTGTDAAFGDLTLKLGQGVDWLEGGAGLLFSSAGAAPLRVSSTATSGNLRVASDNNKDFAVEIWFRHHSGSGDLLSIGSHAVIRHDGTSGLTWEVSGTGDDCREPLGADTWGGTRLDAASNSYWTPLPTGVAPANQTVSFVLSVGANNEKDDMPLLPTAVAGPGQSGWEPFCYYCQYPLCAFRSSTVTPPSGPEDYSGWGNCTVSNNLLWEQYQPYACQGLVNSGASGSSQGEDLAYGQFVHVGTQADPRSFTASDLPYFSLLQLGPLDTGVWEGVVYQVAVYAADTNQNYYSNNNANDSFVVGGIGLGADASVMELNYEDGLPETAYTEPEAMVDVANASVVYTFTLRGWGRQATPLNFSLVTPLEPVSDGNVTLCATAATYVTDNGVTVSECNATITLSPSYDGNNTFTYAVTSYDGTASDTGVVTLIGDVPINATAFTANVSVEVPVNATQVVVPLTGWGARPRALTFSVVQGILPDGAGNLSDFTSVVLSPHPTLNDTYLSSTNITFYPTPQTYGTATFVFRVTSDKGNATADGIVTLVFLDIEPTAFTSASTSVNVPVNATAVVIVLQGWGSRPEGLTFSLVQDVTPSVKGNLSAFSEVGLSEHPTLDNTTLSNSSITFYPTPETYGNATFIYQVDPGRSGTPANGTVTLVFLDIEPTIEIKLSPIVPIGYATEPINVSIYARTSRPQGAFLYYLNESVDSFHGFINTTDTREVTPYFGEYLTRVDFLYTATDGTWFGSDQILYGFVTDVGGLTVEDDQYVDFRNLLPAVTYPLPYTVVSNLTLNVTESSLEAQRSALTTYVLGYDGLNATVSVFQSSEYVLCVDAFLLGGDPEAASLYTRDFDQSRLLVALCEHETDAPEGASSSSSCHAFNDTHRLAIDLLFVPLTASTWGNATGLGDTVLAVLTAINAALEIRAYTELYITGWGPGGWLAVLMAALDTRITRATSFDGGWPVYLDGAGYNASCCDLRYQTLTQGPLSWAEIYTLAASPGRNVSQVFDLGTNAARLAAVGYAGQVAAAASALNGTYAQHYHARNSSGPDLSFLGLVTGVHYADRVWSLDENASATLSLDATSTVSLAFPGAVRGVSGLVPYDNASLALSPEGGSLSFATDPYALGSPNTEYVHDFWFRVTDTAAKYTPTDLFSSQGVSLRLNVDPANLSASVPLSLTLSVDDVSFVTATVSDAGEANHVIVQRRLAGRVPEIFFVELWVNDVYAGYVVETADTYRSNVERTGVGAAVVSPYSETAELTFDNWVSRFGVTYHPDLLAQRSAARTWTWTVSQASHEISPYPNVETEDVLPLSIDPVECWDSSNTTLTVEFPGCTGVLDLSNASQRIGSQEYAITVKAAWDWYNIGPLLSYGGEGRGLAVIVAQVQGGQARGHVEFTDDRSAYLNRSDVSCRTPSPGYIDNTTAQWTFFRQRDVSNPDVYLMGIKINGETVCSVVLPWVTHHDYGDATPFALFGDPDGASQGYATIFNVSLTVTPTFEVSSALSPSHEIFDYTPNTTLFTQYEESVICPEAFVAPVDPVPILKPFDTTTIVLTGWQVLAFGLNYSLTQALAPPGAGTLSNISEVVVYTTTNATYSVANLTFTPNANFTGNATFSFRATPAQTGTASDEVEVTLVGPPARSEYDINVTLDYTLPYTPNNESINVSCTTTRQTLLDFLFVGGTLPTTTVSVASRSVANDVAITLFDTPGEMAWASRVSPNNTMLAVMLYDNATQIQSLYTPLQPTTLFLGDLLTIQLPSANTSLDEDLELVLSGVNAVLANRSYTRVCLTGWARSGWIAVLLAAIDTRFHVTTDFAGSWPLYLQSQSQFIDTCCTTYNIGLTGFPVGYRELYVLATCGNRTLTQVFNVHDTERFEGLAPLGYLQAVQTAVAAVGGGKYTQRFSNRTTRGVDASFRYTVFDRFEHTSYWGFNEIVGTTAYDFNTHAGRDMQFGVSTSEPGVTALDGDGTARRLYANQSGVSTLSQDVTGNGNRPFLVETWLSLESAVRDILVGETDNDAYDPVLYANSRNGSALAGGFQWETLSSRSVAAVDGSTPVHVFAQRREVSGTPVRYSLELFLDSAWEGGVYEPSRTLVDTISYRMFRRQQTPSYACVVDNSAIRLGVTHHPDVLANRTLDVSAVWNAPFYNATSASLKGHSVSYTLLMNGTWTVDEGGDSISAEASATAYLIPDDALKLGEREYTLTFRMSFNTYDTGEAFSYVHPDTGVGVQLRLNQVGDRFAPGFVEFIDNGEVDESCFTNQTDYADGLMHTWLAERVRVIDDPPVWHLRLSVDGELICEKMLSYAHHHDYWDSPILVASGVPLAFEYLSLDVLATTAQPLEDLNYTSEPSNVTTPPVIDEEEEPTPSPASSSSSSPSLDTGAIVAISVSAAVVAVSASIAIFQAVRSQYYSSVSYAPLETHVPPMEE